MSRTKSTPPQKSALQASWNAFRTKLTGDLSGFQEPKLALEQFVKRNAQALLTELAESGEALVLLAKLATKGSLSEAERKTLRAQLVDLAKTIPALGIFALPGGMLLLPILAKTLPWDLVPSAFKKSSPATKEEEEEEEDRDAQG